MNFLKCLPAPVIVLMLLSPAVGELLCGSSPPIKFFNPIGLIIMVLLYGCGAVLIREIVFRWKAGLFSLLLLGAAYGIIEEGLFVKSFTDPDWPDLVSGLGFYGRWHEINCVWAVGLTFYHAIFSITVPVIIAGLIFPNRRNRAWLSRKTFAIFLGLFILDGIFIFSFISKHMPPLLPYLFFIAVTAGLFILARRLAGVSIRADALYLGDGAPPTGQTPSRSTRLKMWLAGFFTGWMVFLTTFSPKGLELPPVSAVILQITLIGCGLYMIFCLAGTSGRLSDRLAFSLASGLLWVMILLAFVQEMKRAERPEAAGMAVVGLAFAAGIFLLGRRIKGIIILPY